MTVLLVFAALAGTPDVAPNLNAHDGTVADKCHRACRRHQRKVRYVRPYSAKLDRMAACESGGRWHINTGNNYFGGLQFSLSTWRSVGGSTYPHMHSVLTQKFRAVRLIHRRGYAPWPSCGAR